MPVASEVVDMRGMARMQIRHGYVTRESQPELRSSDLALSPAATNASSASRPSEISN